MGFEEAYRQWLDKHIAARTGERLRRLQEGHGYGEKLFLSQAWYPAIGNFEDLHPEYEVFDYQDGSRFLDHAFIRYPYKINWETDAYGTHWSKISRRQYDDGLERQNQIIHDGWKVFRFSVDQLKEQPRKCQQFIQQVLGRLYSGNTNPSPQQLSLKEREIVRLTVRTRSNQPITSTDVCQWLGVSRKHAHELLKSLAAQSILMPASGNVRVRSYRLGPRAVEILEFL